MYYKKIILYFLLLLNFNVFSIFAEDINTKPLLVFERKIDIPDGETIYDIEFLDSNNFIYSSGKKIMLMNVNEDFSQELKLDKNIDWSLINKLSKIDNKSFNFFNGSFRKTSRGSYKYSLNNNSIEFLNSDIIIDNLMTLSELKRNTEFEGIAGYNKESNIIYLFKNEQNLGLYDVFAYNYKQKEQKLFLKRMNTAEWLFLDNDLIMCAADKYIIIIDTKGNLLQCIENFVYRSGAVSQDSKYLTVFGNIYKKDRYNIKDFDNETLEKGLLVFRIDKTAKKELMAHSEKTSLSEQKRLLEILEQKKYHVKLELEKPSLSIKLNFMPTIDNLRFRESPTLDGKFIRMLNKNDKLELIEKGKEEIINGTKGFWVKVKTEQGEVGWCFDAYLEAWKRSE